MKFILGKKLEMSQIFADDGTVIPVTKIQAGPCTVTQVKIQEKDGYKAIQVGFGEKKRLNKPLGGHLKGLSNSRHLVEFRGDTNKTNETNKTNSDLKRGDVITVGVFEPGDKVKVTGVSKGKGFQGVVKRHGFHGSPASHGHKDQLRMPGSIGATDPARVFPGMRMPGRMGGEQVTVTNLEIVKIDKDKNLLYIKGAVPGARNRLLEISGAGEMKIDAGDEGNVGDSEVNKVDKVSAKGRPALGWNKIVNKESKGIEK
ncbi:50S ribosomal protein L3 [Patescibacteria group bacterium]|nr:50S ribosomal protein L3 [Patescibacteria group bacterium]MBU4512678.1 50S ribosomal protein L3 [Patescibacteria group bacterium]